MYGHTCTADKFLNNFSLWTNFSLSDSNIWPLSYCMTANFLSSSSFASRNSLEYLMSHWIRGNMFMKSKPWIWWGSIMYGHFIDGSTFTIFSVRDLWIANIIYFSTNLGLTNNWFKFPTAGETSPTVFQSSGIFHWLRNFYSFWLNNISMQCTSSVPSNTL